MIRPDRSRPWLCTTVTAATVGAMVQARDAARDADLVELRVDALDRIDVAGVLAGRRRPVLITCRPAWEGGGFRGSEAERRRVLETAIEAGAEFVDLEWRAGFDDLIARRGGRGIVLSMHDFDGVPSDLAERCRAMRGTGVELVKLAVAARSLSDTLPLLELGKAGAGDGVYVAMGAAGLPTRILAAHYGSCWTYAGDRAEVGQLPAARLLEEFRFRRVTASTRVFGVLGRPILHSVSPAMHNAGFEAAGLDAVYTPLEAASAEDFDRFAAAVGLEGASVTAPYKVEMLARAVEADGPACEVGALNTLRRGPGGWQGRNTDLAGFIGPLAGRMSLPGVRLAVLGAGGAARAAAVAARGAGARVRLHARDERKAADVARAVGVETGRFPPEPRSWDVLVNATPVGTFPEAEASPIAARLLDGGRLVYDLVYNPEATRLLRDAAAAGCDTIGGLEMLVAQAQLQFEWWTGVQISPDLFRAAARQRLRATCAGEIER